jgi:hypothetical protein
MTSWDIAINYGLSFIGTPYTTWCEGPLDDKSPAWAGIGPLPDSQLEEVKTTGMFCAGLINLMLRHIGGVVPTNYPWNGGTEAYYIMYKDKLIPFSIFDVRRGDILFRPYYNVTDQGHIAVALGGINDPVLQSFSWGNNNNLPGVNIDFTLKESHSDGYYMFIIKREDFWQ